LNEFGAQVVLARVVRHLEGVKLQTVRLA
jgi:hypothetical protein